MEQINDKEVFDGEGKLSYHEMKILENYSSWDVTDRMKEQLEDGDLAQRMDREINAYLARDNVSDSSKAHVRALYARVQERINSGDWEAQGVKKSSNREWEKWFMDSMWKAGENIADWFWALWDNVSDAVTTDKKELEAKWWKFATMEVNGEKLEYRTKETSKGTVDIYIDDNGVNTDILNVPKSKVKEALSYYKKTAENDMKMEGFSINTIWKVFDNIGDFVAWDTLDYEDKASNFRMYMDKK